MKPRHGIILSSLTLLFATPAVGADWRYVGTSDNGTTIYVDMETMRPTGDTVNVWVRYDHSRDRTIRFRETKQLVTYNCSARTSTLRSYISYDANGRVVDSGDISTYQLRQNNVAPDTIGDAIMTAVCQ